MQGSTPPGPGWFVRQWRRTRPRSHVATALLIVAGYLALVLGGLAALTLASPSVQASSEQLASRASLTVLVVDGGTRSRTLAGSPSAALPASARGAAIRPAATPPPTDATHLGPVPAHPFRPGWGWVVLGLICFAVVLGLAWPDHRDGG